jgi:DNA-binding MarR family transcriptional regulator
MTETKQAQITLGQAVGQAEAVLTRLLARVLAETGTERQTYLALQRLAVLGETDRETDRETYLRDLAEWLELDLWAARELADKLAAGGLLERDGETVRLSPQGAGLRARILGAGAQATAKLTGPLDPADVSTTISTLEVVTARARELLAT